MYLLSNLRYRWVFSVFAAGRFIRMFRLTTNDGEKRRTQMYIFDIRTENCRREKERNWNSSRFPIFRAISNVFLRAKKRKSASRDSIEGEKQSSVFFILNITGRLSEWHLSNDENKSTLLLFSLLNNDALKRAGYLAIIRPETRGEDPHWPSCDAQAQSHDNGL